MFILSIENISNICTLIGLIVGLVGAIAALIPTLIKLGKALKEIINDKNWTKIKEIADAAMKVAEETGASGADKLTMVIASVKAGCEKCDIILDENLVNNLITYINNTIAWFNSMKEITEQTEGE